MVLCRQLRNISLVGGHFSRSFVQMKKFSAGTLFTDKQQAECYAKFRPQYTEEVFNRIINFCKEKLTDLDLAVDVGCGSGQSTFPLAKYFKQVVGVDVSQQQILNAATHLKNVSFRVGPAEDLSFLQNSSVDLLTIAQAFHWVNQDKFFATAKRVLKPGGSLVIYGYGICQLVPQEANQIFQYYYEDLLGGFWPEGRQMVEQKYADVTLPFFGWIRDDSLVIEKTGGVSDFIGYMGSWSAYIQYSKTHPDNDLLQQAQRRFQNLFPEATDKKEGELKVIWPIFMLMGHKPQ